MAVAPFHIDPGVLASIKDFDWVIRSLALGHYVGKKPSKRLGVGMEFSQYRPYSQGDDLRQLDWKMYARTDRFYVRQSEVEANVDVSFVIDTSRSMLYEEGDLSKLTYAKLLCGVLGFIARENGDHISLTDGESSLSGNDKRHWLRFLHRLQHLEVTQHFNAPVINNKRSKELFVVISDLYEDEILVPFVQSLRTPRNEVVVFHLLGSQEKSLDFTGPVRMKDLETGTSLQLTAEDHANEYTRQLDQWLSSLKHDFHSRGIDYYQVDFSRPMHQTINQFLNHRKRLL